MRTTHVILGAGVAVLVGLGGWLARSTSAPSVPAATSPTSPSRATRAAGATTAGDRAVAPPRVQAAALPVVPVATPPVVPVLSARSTKSAIPGLAADLIDADPRVRRAALHEAAREPVVDPAVLLAASRDPDLEVGIIATDALGKLHANGHLPARELAIRATDPALDARVRVSALNGLGLVPSDEAARLLVDLAARGDPLQRRSAVILLVHQDAEVAMPALIAALGDADEVVRGNAAEALRARSRGRDFGSDAGAWQAWWQSRSR